MYVSTQERTRYIKCPLSLNIDKYSLPVKRRFSSSYSLSQLAFVACITCGNYIPESQIKEKDARVNIHLLTFLSFLSDFLLAYRRACEIVSEDA